jgi:OmcA/MtrC family decaheme c-type cytochrome
MHLYTLDISKRSEGAMRNSRSRRGATSHRLAFALVLATFACDDDDSGDDVPPTDGVACTAKEAADGTKSITCSDGSSVTVSDGEKGDKGDPGEMGEPGPTGRNAAAVGAGLKLEIESVSIPEDLQPVVTLRITDANDQPLDRSGKLTPGAVSTSFVFSKLTSEDGKVGQYAPYSTREIAGTSVDVDDAGVPPAMETADQPWYDNTGTWTELDPNAGTYSYRLVQVLPADYDRTKTHTLSAYANRTFEGVQYISNAIFALRPDGEEVSEHREIITTEGCNACHGALTLHGYRREMQLCISCHVAGMNDPESGNSIDMVQMIHKIHMGEDLPSVDPKTDDDDPLNDNPNPTPYRIWGYMNSLHDWSTVVFPQGKQNCVTCHTGADGDRWKTEMSKAACGACHDRTSFTSPAPDGWTLHQGGGQSDDTRCLVCHAEGEGPIADLDTDVVKVHKRLEELPLRSDSGEILATPPRLAGEVLGVTDTDPDDLPVVRFRVTVDDAPRDIIATPLGRLRFTFAGPTTDYTGYVTFTVQGGSGSSPNVGTLAATGTAGVFTWTAPATPIAATVTLPAYPDGHTMTAIAGICGTDPSGSFAVGMEARITGMATQPNGEDTSVNYPLHNAVYYFGVAGDDAVPRREAVVVENCNNCHLDLRAHGGSRNDPEYCVLCHNANNDSIEVPLPPAGETKPTASVRLSHMIHRIHTGENGANEYNVADHDYSELRFPADTRDCTLCHVPAQYRLPLPELLPSRLNEIDDTGAIVPGSEYFMGATAAACTGCHDSNDTVAHAEIMTSSMGAESCETCHATGSAYDVDVVHAIPGQ